MEIVTYFLGIVWLLKISAIIQAIAWVRKNGARHREQIDQNIKITGTIMGTEANYEEAFFKVFEECGGKKIFPFGIRDYQLLKFIRKHPTGIRRVLAQFISKVLFDSANLVWATALWALLLTAAPWASQGNLVLSYEDHLRVLYILTLFPLATVFTLCIESVYAYARMKSYAWAFYMHRPSGDTFFDELRPFTFLVIRAIFSSATAAYVAELSSNGLGGTALVDAKIGDPLSCIELFVQCIYFAITTIATVGYGDIVPENGWGQMVAFLTMVVGFSLLTLVLASISVASSSSELNDKENSKK